MRKATTKVCLSVAMRYPGLCDVYRFEYESAVEAGAGERGEILSEKRGHVPIVRDLGQEGKGRQG